MWHICITAFHLNSVFNGLHQLLEFGIWSDIFSPSLLEKQQSPDASQQWETCLNVTAVTAERGRQAGGTAYRDVCVWCSSAEPIRHSPVQYKPELRLDWVIKAHFLCSRTVRHWEIKWFTQLKRWCGAIREKKRSLYIALVWPGSAVTPPGSPSASLSRGGMAHTQCQGFSKCPYISQNKHFTCSSAVLQHLQVLCSVCWKKSPLSQCNPFSKVLLSIACRTRLLFHLRKDLKHPPLTGKTQMSTDTNAFLKAQITINWISFATHQWNISRFPSSGTPQVLHLDKFGYTWCTQRTQAKKLDPSTTEEQPQTMNVSQGTFVSFTGLTCQLLGCSSNPVTELNWLVM